MESSLSIFRGFPDVVIHEPGDAYRNLAQNPQIRDFRPFLFRHQPDRSRQRRAVSHYYREGEYWDSERRRNRLRRVCSSWNRFLGEYAHRYVLFTDVWHKRVPHSALRIAVRVRIEPDQCECEAFCYLKNVWGPFWSGLKERMMSTLRECISNAPTEWNMEILDGQLTRNLKHYALIRACAPRLRAVVGAGAFDLHKFSGVDEYLETLFTDGDWGYEALESFEVLRLPRLTTLYIRVASLGFNVEEWELPSLRHLCLDYGEQESMDLSPKMAALRSILRRFGRSLRTFHFIDFDLISLFEASFWTLIPKVEQIQLSRWDHIVPPKDHPLRTIRIPLHTYSYMLFDEQGESNPLFTAQYLPEWISESNMSALAARRHVQIQIDIPWLWLLSSSAYDTYMIHSAIHLDDMCASKGMRLTDCEGVTLDDYILFAIRAYWKEGRAQRRLSTREFNGYMAF